MVFVMTSCPDLGRKFFFNANLNEPDRQLLQALPLRSLIIGPKV